VRPHPADEQVENATERDEDQAGNRPRPPGQEPHPFGHDYLAQAQDFPTDKERQAEQQDQRSEHLAHLLVPAKTPDLRITLSLPASGPPGPEPDEQAPVSGTLSGLEILPVTNRVRLGFAAALASG
jgi:hypothetical protein